MKIKMNKKGFTLIELLIVVAIIAILAAIAIPQFNAYRIRAFNGAAQSDIRNAKTVQESVFAEYRAMGSTQSGITSILAIAAPAANGVPYVTGPTPGCTGTVVATFCGAIVTMIDTDNNQTYDAPAGFGVGASNNVFLEVDVNSAALAVDGVNFTQYRARTKHREGNRGFVTNSNPATCYAENLLPSSDAASYMGKPMTAAGGKPTNPTDMTGPCGGNVADGNPILLFVAM